MSVRSSASNSPHCRHLVTMVWHELSVFVKVTYNGDGAIQMENITLQSLYVPGGEISRTTTMLASGHATKTTHRTVAVGLSTPNELSALKQQQSGSTAEARPDRDQMIQAALAKRDEVRKQRLTQRGIVVPSPKKSDSAAITTPVEIKPAAVSVAATPEDVKRFFDAASKVLMTS